MASELAIDKNLSFVGNGLVNTIIDGNNSVRLFSVGNNITASWADMTLTRGSAAFGGCINASNLSVVTLTRVTASACAATGSSDGGAILSDTVNLIDSTLSGNSAGGIGGGIYSRIALTISNSTLEGNTAFGGGAISAQDGFTITNSTIAANSASSRGGGVLFSPINPKVGTIRHSTISGNTAPNSGGIFVSVSSSVNIGHTLLAGNAATSNPDAFGSFASTGYNVIGNTTGMIITGTTTGNIINGAASPLSLGPLADNGGSTKTMAIGVDSVAFNAGDPAISGAPSTDQRGKSRINSGSIDIGAYEWSPAVSISPATLDINEGTSANVTLTRTGSTTSALTVNLSITQGTGITGADYTLSGASISGQSGSVTATIPAGNSSVNIAVAAENDVVQESSEVLTLTLVDAPGYDLGTTTSSAATLLDNDFVLSVATAGTGSGTVGGSAAGTYNAGSALTLTATPDTGSTFSGWSAGCSGSFNMPSSDLTCTATFTLNSYTVTFDANGGAGTMAPQSASYNTATALTSNSFTNVGYTFAGWNTVAGGTGTPYANGTSYPFTASVTLYAQWTATSQSVTYSLNSGTGTLPTQASVATGGTFSVYSGTAPTKAGYTFGGWNDGTSTYAAGATYTMGTSNITLTAQWTALPNKTVTFDNNGGTGSMSAQATNVPTNLTTNTFTRAGYTFSGWNTVAVGTGTAYVDGASYAFTADVTLYAQWTINQYTVTFDANTGTGTMAPQSANYNVATALTSNSFTKTGYTFAGWNTAAGGTGTAYANAASYPFTASTTLYAQWTFIPTASAISPTSGPTTGGTAVTITGSGFTNGASVKIGGVAATSVAFVNATTLTAVSPAGTAGAKDVVVTNPDSQFATLSNGFTYLTGQAIAGFSPASPVVLGAAPVTLSATGGASGNPIVFASTSASTICTVSGSTLTFVGVGVCNLTADQAAGGDYSAAAQVTASVTINAVKTVSGPSPTGGSITASFSGGNSNCSYASTAFTTPVPPAGVTLPHGVFAFTTTDCGEGPTLRLTITYPQSLPEGTKYYKYGPTPDNPADHWYVLSSAVLSPDRTQFTFSITDNDVGDSNPALGVITDPGGPGVADASAVATIPTLSEWGMILLSGLLALFGVGQLRRRGMAVRV